MGRTASTNVDELQLLVNHLDPGCRLKDPSADNMDKLLKRIREASSSYQQMREEYVRNSVGAPQLSLSTAIPGSLEAAKEAIEHFSARGSIASTRSSRNFMMNGWAIALLC